MKGTSDFKTINSNGSKIPGSTKNTNKQKENFEKFQQNRKLPKFNKIHSSQKVSTLDAVRPFELKRLEFDEDQSADRSKNSNSKLNFTFIFFL